MPAVVELSHIVKRFGGLTALNDVSLTVEKGEQIAIIGASGSGKSTMLRCINHLETIESGRILIEGEPLVSSDGSGRARYAPEADIRRLITKTGMVFQHFNLFPHLTCVENITITPTLIQKENPAQARERALELLRIVGLEQKSEAYPAQLSGGQRQRVAIARALAIKPSILLFDEPTSALDPEVTGDVLRVIRDLADQGYTMLLVTHEIGFAREVARRVVFMDEARIIEDGGAEELLSDPKNPRLKAFLQAVL